MSEKTKAAWHAANTEHGHAQNALAQAGPDELAEADARATEAQVARGAAARAHVKSLDPGYLDREGGKPYHDRVVAPDLKAEYDEALEAWSGDRHGDPDLGARVTVLGEEYAAVRQAARVVDGRPVGPPRPAGDVSVEG
jgi:hypothetical protein